MTDSSARAALLELAEVSKTHEDYITLVWAQRYPHPSPAASTGWPYRASVGLVESKLRKIK